MKPILRMSIAITALSTTGFVLAAPVAPPPATGIDLGAMKLKSRSAAPAQNAVGGAPPAQTSIQNPARTPRSATPGSTAPVSVAPAVVGGAPPAQNASQGSAAPTNTAASGNTASAPQSGIGNMIKSPLGSKAIDMLGSPASNKPAQSSDDRSNDVQVKMPSRFRGR